jgi:hypothetical protein
MRSSPFGGSMPRAVFDAATDAGAAPPTTTQTHVKVDLPPSKYDEPLAPATQTFPREYVEELRNENKTWRGKMQSERTAREAAEARITAAEAIAARAKEAAETEAGTKVKDAETKANERIIRAELKLAAKLAGMVDLDGLKLADLSTVKLKDDGTVEGADELMASLKEKKPYLFGTATTGSSNPTPPPKPDPGTPKHARDMTPAEREAKLNELKRLGR